MALAWNGAVAVYRVAICLGSVQGANFVPQLGVISEGAQLLTWIVSSFNDLREKDEELNSTELRFQLVRTRYDNVSKQCLVGADLLLVSRLVPTWDEKKGLVNHSSRLSPPQSRARRAHVTMTAAYRRGAA